MIKSYKKEASKIHLIKILKSGDLLKKNFKKNWMIKRLESPQKILMIKKSESHQKISMIKRLEMGPLISRKFRQNI